MIIIRKKSVNRLCETNFSIAKFCRITLFSKDQNSKQVVNNFVYYLTKFRVFTHQAFQATENFLKRLTQASLKFFEKTQHNFFIKDLSQNVLNLIYIGSLCCI